MLLDPFNLPPGAFYIKGQVPSSKNSKQIICKQNGKCLSKPRIIDSELTRAYIASTTDQWVTQSKNFRRFIEGKPFPLHIEFTFIRETAGLWDFVGPLETVLDIMSGKKWEKNPLLKGVINHIRWLPDDNVQYVLPYPGVWFKDSQNAGVIIKVL